MYSLNNRKVVGRVIKTEDGEGLGGRCPGLIGTT
jgi:hypothetical protein